MSGTVNEETTTTTTTTTKTPGQLALEEVAAKFDDMTATECELGFGDCHCDYRAPLAQVAIFKAAEKAAADESDEAVAAATKKTDADAMHEPTAGKVEKLKKFYSELYPKEKDDTKTTGDGKEPSEGQE